MASEDLERSESMEFPVAGFRSYEVTIAADGIKERIIEQSEGLRGWAICPEDQPGWQRAVREQASCVDYRLLKERGQIRYVRENLSYEMMGERSLVDRKSTRLNSSHANISYAV